MNDLCLSADGDNLPHINASPTFRNAVESGAVVRWRGGNRQVVLTNPLDATRQLEMAPPWDRH